MANKRPALGQGLDSLFAANSDDVDSVSVLRLSDIEPNPQQPRKEFDPEKLRELADSIGQHGLLQPIVVRPADNGFYQIVAGERRWRAAKMAGLDEIQVVVRELDDRAVMELALVENLQREDLNPIEEAEGYRALIDECEMTQEEAAKRVGCSRSSVTNSLRLLGLPDSVRELVKAGKLTGGHARALLSIQDEAALQEVAENVAAEELSVRQTERLVKKVCEELANAEQEEKQSDPGEVTVNYIERLEKKMSETIGRKVRIVNGRKKGRIELEYYGNEDLDEIIRLLCGGELDI